MHDCDVMICIGARFDDRITGRVDAFSPGSKKIHVDIDRSSINKNVHVDLPIVGDCATRARADDRRLAGEEAEDRQGRAQRRGGPRSTIGARGNACITASATT